VTHTDLPEVDWAYDAKVGLVKTAWWSFLGVLAWVAVVAVWRLIAM
jgi:hypothetical protein